MEVSFKPSRSHPETSIAKCVDSSRCPALLTGGCLGVPKGVLSMDLPKPEEEDGPLNGLFGVPCPILRKGMSSAQEPDAHSIE